MSLVADRLRPWFGMSRRAVPLPNPTLIDEGGAALLEATSDDIICRIGQDFRIRRLSPNAARLFGPDADDVLGRLPDSFIALDDMRLIAATAAMARARATRPTGTAIRFASPTAGNQWVRVTIRPLHGTQPDGARDTILLMHEVTRRTGLRERLATPTPPDGPAGASERRAFEAELADLTDTATDVASRVALDESLALEWARAARQGTELSLLLIGLDGSSPSGDRTEGRGDDDSLRAVAAVAEGAGRRADDQTCYYQREELALLLPRTPEPGAAVVAEKIRAAVIKLRLPRPGARGNGPQVTASLGVATATSCRPNAMTSPSILLQAADAALTQARQSGAGRMVGARLRTPSDNASDDA